MEESFWDEKDESSEQILNEHLILIPQKIKDLENDVIDTKEQLDYIEFIRAKQHEKLLKIQNEYIQYADGQQYSEYKKMLNRIGNIGIEVSSVLDNQVLKIDMDFLLPVYHKTKNIKIAYYNALRDIYQRGLIIKLNHHRAELPNLTECKKVFVLIVQYFKNNNITDLDNRFHSFIFNALRSSGVISDDRWQKLAYMEDGRHTIQKAKTEIYVGDYEMAMDIFQLVNNRTSD
jgi:hypothetical protein